MFIKLTLELHWHSVKKDVVNVIKLGSVLILGLTIIYTLKKSNQIWIKVCKHDLKTL